MIVSILANRHRLGDSFPREEMALFHKKNGEILVCNIADVNILQIFHSINASFKSKVYLAST